MPPIRAGPTIRPVRTERTHEENQERAYIAASRRSDRSLEARVESARRASEIHKKRTGRSLRVREEDVMNEEMYEEEDDDLPMQYRRISALNPSFQYTQLSERVNNYLAGQVGVRNYLYSAIWNANQNQHANQLFNPMMQHNNLHPGTMSPQAMTGQLNGQQSPFSMPSVNDTRPGLHHRSASIATTQELANYASPTQTAPTNMTGTGFDAQKMSPNNVRSPNALSPTTPSSPPPTPFGQQKTSPGSHHVSTPPQFGQTLQPQGTRTSVGTPPVAGPLTTQLPIEAQQLLDGSAMANSVHASQFTPGVPMPSMSGYNYNPNSKKPFDVNHPTGLHQTLNPFNLYNSQAIPCSEPQSAVSAPGNLDFGFNHDFNDELGYDPNIHFGMNFGSGSRPGTAHNSRQVTPSEGNWNESDFFNYAAASD